MKHEETAVFYSKLGERIKNLLSSHGITNETLKNELGIGSDTIQLLKKEEGS